MDMVNFAAQVCGMAQPGRDFVEMPDSKDFSGLIHYTHTTDNGLVLKCWLEHEDAVTGGGDAHPDTGAKVWLVYAFAGLVDVFELVEQVPGLKDKIEAEALKSMKMDQWNVEYDRGEQRAQDRADWSAA